MIVVLLGLILVALLFPGFLRLLIGIAALGLGVAIIAGGAKAQTSAPPLPTIDVDAVCLSRSRFTQDRSQARIVINECVKNEQTAYDILKFDWSESPVPVRAECLHIMIEGRRPMEQMYGPLLTCFESRMGLWKQKHGPDQKFIP